MMCQICVTSVRTGEDKVLPGQDKLTRGLDELRTGVTLIRTEDGASSIATSFANLSSPLWSSSEVVSS